MIASIWGSKFWEGSGGVEGTGIWSSGFARVFGGNREPAKVGDDPSTVDWRRTKAAKGGPVHFLWPFWLWIFIFFFSFSIYHKPRFEHLNLVYFVLTI